jgi:phage replication-related protein YjqB (UPF0714/DUF867 family)
MTMKHARAPIDASTRRHFLRTLGAAALPLLVSSCDSSVLELDAEAQFRAKPSSPPGKPPKSKPNTHTVVEVEVVRALLEQAIIHDSQRCSLPAQFADFVGIGEQIRIIRDSGEIALYTVDELRTADEPDLVRMNLVARQRIGSSEPFPAKLDTAVTATGLSDAQAEAQSEFVERLVDGKSSSFIALAPHGGAIERYTDSQAEYVQAALAKFGASSWVCKGWVQGGGAFDRWHIRSTDLSPRSFKGLGTIARRGFAYAVAFHGMQSEGVLIGGAGPAALKREVAAAITAAINDTAIEVSIATTADVYDGESPENVVNWLTADGFGGVQIEEGPKARSRHWQTIAQAVADVYQGLL